MGKEKKNISQNNSNLNLGLSSLNKNMNIENNFNSQKEIDNLRKSFSSKHILVHDVDKVENSKLAKGNKVRGRNSVVNIRIKSLNKDKIIPKIQINGIKIKRKSCVPIAITNFNKFKIVNTLNSNRSEKQNGNKNDNNNSMRKIKSQPNVFSRGRQLRQIYDKITKIHFHPFKKFKNEESINDLYKKFYGDKMKILNKNYYNSEELLKIYFNIKVNIIQNERNDYIYTKYKELLPNIMKNNIKINNEKNERLKEQPLKYIKALYHKKYLEQLYKND